MMLARRAVPRYIQRLRPAAAAASSRLRATHRCRVCRPSVFQWRAQPAIRSYATESSPDEIMEEITELYATARDEFEIAAEETVKMTVYAEDDRAAAREELTRLQQAYKRIVDGADRGLAEEIQRRVGQRIRELENAVEAMEEMAKNQD